MNESLIIPGILDQLAAGSERVQQLLSSEYGEYMKAAYDALDVSVLFTSKVHGQGHIERTILLGAMIAQAQKLSAHEVKMLLLCCSYHDVGRHSDWFDPDHGAVSAVKMTQPPIREKFAAFGDEDFAVMRAAVASHSINDKFIPDKSAEFGVSPALQERFFRIARCLKDADNLDRVRIHDLDVRHLRHPESVSMAKDAEFFLQTYNAAL